MFQIRLLRNLEIYIGTQFEDERMTPILASHDFILNFASTLLLRLSPMSWLFAMQAKGMDP